MKYIASNENLIDILKNDLSIISAKIYSINIYKTIDDVLSIDVNLKLLYANTKDTLLLRFIDIKEYSFFYHFDYFFYTIEIVKFFFEESKVYISFDPIDETNVISENDQDYIISKSVDGYFVTV